MKVLLLAAGLGTRLRPITDTTPKCLVPIMGKPLLGHWFELLKAIPELSEVYVNCHYLAEQVRQFIQSTTDIPCPISIINEQELLGTAGTLCHEKFKDCAEPVMLVHADNLSMFSMAQFIQNHQNRPANCAMTMMLFTTDTPESCGIVSLSELNVVTEMHEKVQNPPGNLANGAVYILEPEIIKTIRTKGFQDFSTQVIPQYLGAINSWQNDGYHRDIGTIKSYQTAQQDYPDFLKSWRLQNKTG